MKVSEAITSADALRPNTIDDRQKAKWLREVDADIAELMEVSVPDDSFPIDKDLLMEAPHDRIYVLYLVAQYDYYNQENTLYANDMEVFNNALNEAKAWYRRRTVPNCKIKQWGVM